MARKTKEEVNIDKKMMTLTDKDGQEKKIPMNNKQIAEVLYGKNLAIRGKNARQKELLTEIGLKEITIAVGPAGVGKSYLSVAKALELLASPDNNYQKIYVCTPAVDADEKLGFLKGSLEDKLDPYLFSTYYLMDKIIGKSNRKKLQELQIVEPMALAFIKGVNIDNAIFILEESQNTTPGQMKNVLTRIGFSSKFIISGDLEQVDRMAADKCGLHDALIKLKDMKEIAIVQFDQKDIVRNPLIGKILAKY
jgi:phosphate starvation-inducible protein PhoH and related proteins